MFPQELLLAKSGCPDFKKWLSGVPHRQFQSCGSTLALHPIPQDLLEPRSAHRISEQVAGTWLKLSPVVVPPRLDCLWIGPRQIFVRIHVDNLIFWILGWPGFEAFGLFTVKIFI
jgi:hypothetical protein